MICKHKYFELVDGHLVCSECGQPPKQGEPQIEDKAMERQETKQGRRR